MELLRATCSFLLYGRCDDPRSAYPGPLCPLEPFHQREGLLPLRPHQTAQCLPSPSARSSTAWCAPVQSSSTLSPCIWQPSSWRSADVLTRTWIVRLCPSGTASVAGTDGSPATLNASGGPRLRSVHRVGDHGGGGQGVGSLLRWGRAGGGVRGVGRPPDKGGPAGRFASRDPRLVVLLEANEGSLAHLLCKPLWVVARPTPRVFAQQNSLAYPHPYLLYLLTINLYRGSPLRRIAGD